MGKISHFIITRFNIPLTDEIVTNYIDKIDVETDDKYLEKRFYLFFKFTVPSMMSQTNLSFDWLVFFSENTPKKFRIKINELEKMFPNFKPVFIGKGTSIKALVKSIISNQTSLGSTVVTTRLDNDDAIRADFIKIVQENARKSDTRAEAIIFLKGLQYEPKKGLATEYYFPENHFSSLVSRNLNEMNTIVDFNHMEIPELFPTQYLEDSQEMWVEIVHENNLLNRLFLNRRTKLTKLDNLRDFGIDESLKKISKNRLCYLTIMNKPQNLLFFLHKYGIRKSLKKSLNKRIRGLDNE